MFYARPRICRGKWDAQTHLGFREINGSNNLDQTTGPHNNENKEMKKTCRIVNFAVSACHRVKVKESEKKDKYFDLQEKWKKSMEHESDDNSSCKWFARYSH